MLFVYCGLRIEVGIIIVFSYKYVCLAIINLSMKDCYCTIIVSYEFWFSHEILYLPSFFTHMCLFFNSFKNSKQRSHLTQFRFWWVDVLKTSPSTWRHCQANKISVPSCLFQPQTSWLSNSALMHLWKEKDSGKYSISIYCCLVSWTTDT